MNLRTKLNLGSAALILVVVSGVMISLYMSEKKQIGLEIQNEQSQDLAKLARVCEESLITTDELILINYVKTLLRSPKVSYAGYVDSHGSGWLYADAEDALVLVHPDDRSIQEILSSHSTLRRDLHTPQGRITELSQPIQGKGYVRLGYSRDVVDQLFHESLAITFQRLTVVGFVTIIFGLLLAQLFAVAMSRPINNLMKAAEDIAHGKKGVQIPEKGSDELGQLTKTFNRMSHELTKLDQLKDDFMSHVTHELRSPLTSIIATVELMSEMPIAQKDAKFRRSIDRLIYGSERLNRLVDNILDLTRMEAGKMQFDIQPVNIATLVTEMADFFEPRAFEKGLKITAIVPPKFPLAMADPERIRQVISNLVHNAIKFTNTGGIVLWVREKEGFIQVGVQDTGVGIPKDQLSSVFEKFETLKDTRNRVQKPVPGSGLGLNIVKNSIKAQGGKIWVESEVDKGSTFIFTLPIASAGAQAMPVVPKEASATMVAPKSDDVVAPANPRQPVMMENPKKAVI